MTGWAYDREQWEASLWGVGGAVRQTGKKLAELADASGYLSREDVPRRWSALPGQSVAGHVGVLREVRLLETATGGYRLTMNAGPIRTEAA